MSYRRPEQGPKKVDVADDSKGSEVDPDEKDPNESAQETLEFILDLDEHKGAAGKQSIPKRHTRGWH